VGGGVQLGSLSTEATNRPIVPAPGDYDDGEIGGMMIGRGNWSTRRKSAPVPLCPPQTPHAAQMWTRAAAMGNQRLTAWAMARPLHWPYLLAAHLLEDSFDKPDSVNYLSIIQQLSKIWYCSWSYLKWKKNKSNINWPIQLMKKLKDKLLTK
jgi:hypothetical protein